MVGEDLSFDVALAEAQRRGLRPISGGDGTAAPPNPWAAYGLDALGQPIKPEDKKADTDATATEIATLKSKLADAEAKLGKQSDDFAGLSKKLEIVDRLTKALGGDASDPTDPKTKEVWDDLKAVAKKTAPGVAKLLDMLEKDPDALDRITGGVDALAGSRLQELNIQAHDRVLAKAKQVFKGYTPQELEEAVYPYEQTMTAMINADPKIQRQFVSGNLKVVDEMFDRLYKPHVSARLREKQAKTTPNPNAVKAPPKGSGAPGAGDGDDQKPKARDFSPAGKQAFLKGAVSRWMDKGRKDDD